MHQSVIIFARYNRRVNLQMLKSIERLSAEQIREERGVYFKSVIGILNHILNCDKQWLKELLVHLPEARAAMEKCPQFEIPDYMAVPFPTLDEFRPQRVAMDECMVEYVESVSTQRMEEYFEGRDWQGKARRLRIGSAFLHLFNHQTHHRGQISALLDQFDIENDWSNMVLILGDIDPEETANDQP